LLFDKLREHALEAHPNPERVGCLDRATLKAWVFTPEKLNLSDPKYLHVLKCAECTRELIELRMLRNEQSERLDSYRFICKQEYFNKNQAASSSWMMFWME
jgi:hypothetical protein